MITFDQHKQIHKELHRAFDELLADYLLYSEKLPSEITVFELMKWSYIQTIDPQEGGLHRQ
jgi:hypothetical protein